MFSKVLIAALMLAVATCAVAPTANEAPLIRSTNQYYISTSTATFLQAWAYCKNANMRFVSLPTSTQNQALADYLAGIGAPATSLWVGGVYLRNGFLAQWYWTDSDQPFSWTNWSSTPSPTTADYCIAYSYSSTTKTGSWVATTCATAKYFVCSAI